MRKFLLTAFLPYLRAKVKLKNHDLEEFPVPSYAKFVYLEEKG